MKKIHSNGHALVQTESTLSFASYCEEEYRTYFYQYDGEYVKEITKEAYMESMFGVKLETISSQLTNPNFSYIESIAKCWVEETGNSKLMYLKEYYNNTLGPDWENDFGFSIFPENLLSTITSFNVCTIQNDTVCLVNPHDMILQFNEHGQLMQYMSLGSTDYCDTLYHICSDGQAIWGVSPTMNSIVKYTYPSLKIEKIYHYTTRENLIQIHKETSPTLHIFCSENELVCLNYPESISYIDGQFYICDMANKRIVLFDPDNGKITPHITLDSHPFEFFKWKNHLVIQSETGIYLLNDSD